MNGINIYSIIVTIGLVVLGFISSYFKSRKDLVAKAGEWINIAEENYKSATKSGSEKMSFVVETLFNILPSPMRIFITKPMIEEIVQNVFDQAQEFANKQLDKVVDKIVDQN